MRSDSIHALPRVLLTFQVYGEMPDTSSVRILIPRKFQVIFQRVNRDTLVSFFSLSSRKL